VLETPDGSGDIVDLPAFPEDWRAAGLAHRETLNAFRSEGVDLDWTYVCPPTGIAPGERTGVYRVGVDRLLVDEEGQSTVSAEDFAVGVADLLESGDHVRERVTIAY
jgi:putative NADH-flavin reductase